MKLVTWNVNGLRACMNKGFKESMENWTPISSLSRKRRCSGNRPALTFPAIMNIGTVPLKRLLRNGHLSRIKPLSVTYGLGIEEHDQEGRVITAEYDDFTLSMSIRPIRSASWLA